MLKTRYKSLMQMFIQILAELTFILNCTQMNIKEFLCFRIPQFFISYFILPFFQTLILRFHFIFLYHLLSLNLLISFNLLISKNCCAFFINQNNSFRDLSQVGYYLYHSSILKALLNYSLHFISLCGFHAFFGIHAPYSSLYNHL